MILRKVFFIFLCAATGVWPNLRAPVRIDRAGSELRAEKAALKVLGETLEFHCPEAHTGKMNFDLFAARACDARVRYKIFAAADEKVKLSFVFSGSGNVSFRYREKLFTAAPQTRKIDDRKLCSFCPDAMKNLQIAEQILEFEKGEGELEIQYRQALSYDERGHSYFSNGNWTQGFTYELWPIAEWQWADNITASVQLSIGARSGFLGIGYKNDQIRCVVEENEKQTEIPLTVTAVKDERRSAATQVKLAKKPQRLRCSYSAD